LRADAAGNPNGAAALRRAGKGGAPLREAIARDADRHARDLAPVVDDIRAAGATSLRAIAAELNGRGMLTRRGGRWHVSTVMNLLERLALALHSGDGPTKGEPAGPPCPEPSVASPDEGTGREHGLEHLCHRFGISRPTAHRRYDYALSVIAWRLNGRQVHHRRGRRFVVARAG
jgi:hypothetical protein